MYFELSQLFYGILISKIFLNPNCILGFGTLDEVSVFVPFFSKKSWL